MKNKVKIADDSTLAFPHPIETIDGPLVPIKIISVNAKIVHTEQLPPPPNLEIPTGKVEATMVFRPLLDGFPMFDLVKRVLGAALDGVEIPAGDVSDWRYHTDETPVPITTFKILKRKLVKGQVYTLTLRYSIDLLGDKDYDELQGFAGTTGPTIIKDLPITDLRPPISTNPRKELPINLLSFMRDVTYERDKGFRGRSLLEKWFPANFEFDQFPLTFSFSTNSVNASLEIISNGTLTNPGTGKDFEVSFPEYFTAASHFFHIYDRNAYSYYRTAWDYVRADGSKFPITFYTNVDLNLGSGPAHLANQQREINRRIGMFETRVGLYPHASLIVFQSHILWGGQEYVGATISHGGVEIKHEVLHSWYGRCVMPANGNAGWIDEAMVDYLLNSSDLKTPDANQENRLAGFDDHYRVTNWSAYVAGSFFFGRIAALDKVRFDAFVKAFFEANKFKVYTNAFFVASLKEAMGETHSAAIDALLDKYVYLANKKIRTINSENEVLDRCNEKGYRK